MNDRKQDIEINEIHFWDREMNYEEELYFRYSELKKEIYLQLGLPVKLPVFEFINEYSIMDLN